MTGTILELVNNQKTKVTASYKILFCNNRTTFKHQSSKEENKKKKKENRRRLATNVFSPTSTVTNLICYRRCVRQGFICKSFYLFFKFLIRPGSCRVRSPSVWGVRLFCLQFTWEEWWLNFKGSISMQQLNKRRGGHTKTEFDPENKMLFTQPDELSKHQEIQIDNLTDFLFPNTKANSLDNQTKSVQTARQTIFIASFRLGES